MNIFHFLLAQYVTMAVWQKKKKKKNTKVKGEKKNPLSEIDVQLMSQLLSLEIR